MPRVLDQWMSFWGYLPKHLQIQGSLYYQPKQQWNNALVYGKSFKMTIHLLCMITPEIQGRSIALATQTQGNSRDKSGQLVQCYHRFCDPGLLSSYETQVRHKLGIFSQNQPMATKFRRLHLWAGNFQGSLCQACASAVETMHPIPYMGCLQLPRPKMSTCPLSPKRDMFKRNFPSSKHPFSGAFAVSVQVR